MRICQAKDFTIIFEKDDYNNVTSTLERYNSFLVTVYSPKPFFDNLSFNLYLHRNYCLNLEKDSDHFYLISYYDDIWIFGQIKSFKIEIKFNRKE